MIKKITDFIDYNRFAVATTILTLLVWFYAIGCTPLTESPVSPGQAVNAAELETEFAVWQKQNEAMMIRFEAAGRDLQQQAENQAKIQQAIMSIASGQVTNFGALAELLMSGGLIGVIADNIRKNGVIAGLKRNKVV